MHEWARQDKGSAVSSNRFQECPRFRRAGSGAFNTVGGSGDGGKVDGGQSSAIGIPGSPGPVCQVCGVGDDGPESGAWQPPVSVVRGQGGHIQRVNPLPRSGRSDREQGNVITAGIEGEGGVECPLGRIIVGKNRDLGRGRKHQSGRKGINRSGSREGRLGEENAAHIHRNRPIIPYLDPIRMPAEVIAQASRIVAVHLRDFQWWWRCQTE